MPNVLVNEVIDGAMHVFLWQPPGAILRQGKGTLAQ